ncbi:MAG TPA: carboxypeptidase-like regulatory domain-containing protein, partial [Chitinophagaceae bacterium]
MKHILAFLFCAGSLLTVSAQVKNNIRGKVVQGESGAPISNASVFITNTSKGTVSDSSGNFELADVPEGTYDLVISSIGFETQVYTYNAAQLPLRLQVRLGPKVEVLQDVVVEPDEKNGWEKWSFFFTQNFLGSNEAGRSCKIKNYK